MEEAAGAQRAEAAKIKKAQHAACKVKNSDKHAGTEGDNEDTNPVCSSH